LAERRKPVFSSNNPAGLSDTNTHKERQVSGRLRRYKKKRICTMLLYKKKKESTFEEWVSERKGGVIGIVPAA